MNEFHLTVIILLYNDLPKPYKLSHFGGKVKQLRHGDPRSRIKRLAISNYCAISAPKSPDRYIYIVSQVVRAVSVGFVPIEWRNNCDGRFIETERKVLTIGSHARYILPGARGDPLSYHTQIYNPETAKHGSVCQQLANVLMFAHA